MKHVSIYVDFKMDNIVKVLTFIEQYTDIKWASQQLPTEYIPECCFIYVDEDKRSKRTALTQSIILLKDLKIVTPDEFILSNSRYKKF